MNSLLLDTREAVVTITLNRPDQGNAIDMDLASQLRDVAREVALDEQVRCVVLTGQGKMFCAGGDIHAFAAATDRRTFLSELARTLHEAVTSFAMMEKPLVVLVNGPAAGAGLSLTAIGDVVLAADVAHFTAAYTRIGLTPDGGLTWLLPKLIGVRRAQEMIIGNRRLSADEAVAFGLVTRTVPHADLAAQGAAAADDLAEASTMAIGASRALLLRGAAVGFTDHLDAEAAMIGESAARADGREGVAAFLECRPPSFGSPDRPVSAMPSRTATRK